MAHTHGKYAGFEDLRKQAVALRRAGRGAGETAGVPGAGEGGGTKREAAASIGELTDRELFIAGVALYWAEGSKPKLRVCIHETADVRAAEKYWADVVGVYVSKFSRATLKKHNPRTVRKNTGANYRGCLVLYVRQSATLYRRMEGAWYGIVGGAVRRTD
ncbi:hypothetical protein [Streptomyces sp. NPDC093018]|uniref:hypothetical protein n=1 Tax=Streptomyces sp. NPDC093018 TaxID=3155067 RepID=UPI003448A41E